MQKAGAFKTSPPKIVIVSLLWGTAAGFLQVVPRSPGFPLCCMETGLEKCPGCGPGLVNVGRRSVTSCSRGVGFLPVLGQCGQKAVLVCSFLPSLLA